MDAELSRTMLYQQRQCWLSGVPSWGGDPSSAWGHHSPQPQFPNPYVCQRVKPLKA